MEAAATGRNEGDEATMRDVLDAHFDKILEMGVLVFIFVFATLMLAFFKGNEEMSRWIENGAIIAVLARAFGTSTKTPKTEVITNSTESEIKP